MVGYAACFGFTVVVVFNSVVLSYLIFICVLTVVVAV